MAVSTRGSRGPGTPSSEPVDGYPKPLPSSTVFQTRLPPLEAGLLFLRGEMSGLLQNGIQSFQLP